VKGSNLLRRVILVVDDEPLIVLNLKTVLEVARANVISANTRDAGKVVERPDISAAVLDARPESRLKLRNLPFLFYSLPLRYLPDRGGLRRSHCWWCGSAWSALGCWGTLFWAAAMDVSVAR
jgi:hypothetical protein